MAKYELVFVLTQKNAKKEHRFSWKMLLGIFKLTLCFRDRHDFMWQLLKILNVFNTITLKKIFLKTKTFFKKLEDWFLVESTKIENAMFPNKIALSESNVKANSTGSTKWTYRKERSFASNYLFCVWNFCFSLRISYKELI